MSRCVHKHSRSSTRKKEEKRKRVGRRDNNKRIPLRPVCTHTHIHARVARITFGFISRMLIFQNKRRRTDGSRRRQFCSVARVRIPRCTRTQTLISIRVDSNDNNSVSRSRNTTSALLYSCRYNQQQDEEKEKLTLYCFSSLFYAFTFARRIVILLLLRLFFLVGCKRQRRKETE